MVNSKYVAFKVDRQACVQGPPPLPVGTVINLRKTNAKRPQKKPEEPKSQKVMLSMLSREKKRKRGEEELDEAGQDGEPESQNPHLSKSPKTSVTSTPTGTTTPAATSGQKSPNQFTSKRRINPGKSKSSGPSVELHPDCWMNILDVSSPGTLLQMRSHVPYCSRLLRLFPSIWKTSRIHGYGADLPPPLPELDEVQYADLRHGHGCQSCHTRNTRKTYWAFLRRWCKACFQAKIIKETEAIALLKSTTGEDISHLRTGLSTGVVDSWGNYLGVGPSQTHSLKTVYLLSDVRKLLLEYDAETARAEAELDDHVTRWAQKKTDQVQQRREFARMLEIWEDKLRSEKSSEYNVKKDLRKTYFIQKAAEQFDPPMEVTELALYDAFRRAVAIPKDPNLLSWRELKPKLQKEREDAAAAAERERRIEREGELEREREVEREDGRGKEGALLPVTEEAS